MMLSILPTTQSDSRCARILLSGIEIMHMHTAGSHMADQQVDLRLVRDNLGHASLTTTSMYLHIVDDRRHHETDEEHRIDW